MNVSEIVSKVKTVPGYVKSFLFMLPQRNHFT